MSSRIMRALVLVVALAMALIQPAAAQYLDTLRVILLSSESYYPIVSNTSATEFIGYEPSLAEALCAQLNATCTWVPVSDFEDRFTLLNDGEADFAVAVISVTEARKNIVDFVYPFYYSAGTTLFAPEGTIAAAAGWGALAGQTVCVEDGDYAATVVPEYGLQMRIISTNNTDAERADDVTASIAAGECIGVMGDSTQENNLGQPNNGMAPLAVSPYGVAVALGNAALAAKLSAASISMMSDGAASQILAMEQEWVIPAGLPANPYLEATVDSVSNFSLNSTDAVTRTGAATTAPAKPAAKPTPAPTDKTLRVAVYVSDDWYPFVRNTSATTFEGYEPAIAESLCTKLNASCTWVPVTNLDDRFTKLNNGEADFTIAEIAVTEKRKGIVNFVYPFYYSSGTTLYAPPGTVDATAGWEALSGSAVCMEQGNYAADVVHEYGIEVVYITFSSNATNAEKEAALASKIKSGECIGVMDDSAAISSFNQPYIGLPTLATTPVGIATALTAAGSELAGQLSAAMTTMMNDGAASEIMTLEEDIVIPGGLPANPYLAATVNAISNFTLVEEDAPAPGPAPTHAPPASGAAAAAAALTGAAALLALAMA